MNQENVLKIIDNSIVIGPSEFRTFFLMLKNSNPKIHFSYMSKESVLSEIFGSFNENSIKEVMKIEGVTFSIASSILNAISHGYWDDKYKYLKDKYLYKDEYSKLNYLNHKVVVFGFENDPEINHIIEETGVKNVEFLSFDDIEVEQNNKEIFKFDDKYEEARFVLNDIISRVENNKENLSDFVIHCDKSYEFIVDKFAKLFNLPVNFSSSNTLLDTISAKRILKNKLEIIESVVNDENKFIDDLDNYKKIKNLINFYELKFDKYFYVNLVNILESESVREDRFVEAISVTSKEDFEPTKKVYFLGAIDGILPVVKKDNDYFSDEFKAKNKLITSKEFNIFSNKIYAKYITSKCLNFVSYPSENGKNEVAFFLKRLGFVEVNPKLNLNQYSLDLGNIYFGHYGMKNDIFKEQKEEYKYMVSVLKKRELYTNIYTSINRIQKENKTHSYSSIELYADCPFKYYISKILGLDTFEQIDSAILGQAEHAILEHVYDDDFDFEKEEKNAIKDLNNKCLMLWQRCRDDLKSCIELINKQRKDHPFISTKNEQAYKVDFDGFSIYGKVDRILNYNDGFVVIDYKSGSYILDKDLIMEYGIGMQLPTYLLLISNSKGYENLKPICSLIQPTMTKSFSNFYEKDDEYYKNFKLKGLVSKNIDLVRNFDDSFDTDPKRSSHLIESLRLTNKGFTTKNALNDDEFKEMIDKCVFWYGEFDKKIKANIFDISPFVTSKESGCKYCNFKDICFVKKHQIRDLKSGGEEDE